MAHRMGNIHPNFCLFTCYITYTWHNLHPLITAPQFIIKIAKSQEMFLLFVFLFF